MKEDLYLWCKDWRIEYLGLEMDHHLVSVNMMSENMPYLGRGRWMIPIGLLHDKHLKRETQKHWGQGGLTQQIHCDYIVIF